ncbi:MAG: hypothetical protein IPL63_02490 [Saprospiraceae bacterium]|nr:hypothetical protein [Saprospiraceae bacterium]
MASNQLVFPSTETVNKLIEELNGIKWEIYQGGDIYEHMEQLEKKFFSRLPFMSTYLKKTPVNFTFPIKFYRVRPFSKIINDRLICEYSYPIPKFTTENGRANFINHPVFYASDHPVVALLEYIQKVDDIESFKDKEFIISKWEIKSPGEYLFAPFFNSNLTSHNIFTKLAEFTKEEFEALGNTVTDDEYNALKLMNNYLAELFLVDDKRCISSYLAHKNIYDNPIGHCFIIYASKMVEYHGNNYAFHPNFVDTQMELKHIYKIKIDNISKDGHKFQIMNTMTSKFGVNIKGIINWVEIENNLDNFNAAYRNDFGNEIKFRTKDNN